jgi:hypothetical protein
LGSPDFNLTGLRCVAAYDERTRHKLVVSDIRSLSAKAFRKQLKWT